MHTRGRKYPPWDCEYLYFGLSSFSLLSGVQQRNGRGAGSDNMTTYLFR